MALEWAREQTIDSAELYGVRAEGTAECKNLSREKRMED